MQLSKGDLVFLVADTGEGTEFCLKSDTFSNSLSRFLQIT